MDDQTRQALKRIREDLNASSLRLRAMNTVRGSDLAALISYVERAEKWFSVALKMHAIKEPFQTLIAEAEELHGTLSTQPHLGDSQ